MCFKTRVGNRKDDYDTIMQKENGTEDFTESSLGQLKTNKKKRSLFFCGTPSFLTDTSAGLLQILLCIGLSSVTLKDPSVTF